MWDYVRPRYWHPMSTLEQSMMELDAITNQMFMRPTRYPFGYVPFALEQARLANHHHRHHHDHHDHSIVPYHDDFFDDILMDDTEEELESIENNTNQDEKHIKSQQDQPQQQQQKESATSEPNTTTSTSVNKQDTNHHAFSSYSYSTSSILDKHGKRIVNTRRRYEDSNGRLKAIHDREIDGKKMKTIWHRKNKNDKGEHKSSCSSGTVDEFEKLWSSTPFGKAQKNKDNELQQEAQAALEHEKTGGEELKDMSKDEGEPMTDAP